MSEPNKSATVSVPLFSRFAVMTVIFCCFSCSWKKSVKDCLPFVLGSDSRDGKKSSAIMQSKLGISSSRIVLSAPGDGAEFVSYATWDVMVLWLLDGLYVYWVILVLCLV